MSELREKALAEGVDFDGKSQSTESTDKPTPEQVKPTEQTDAKTEESSTSTPAQQDGAEKPVGEKVRLPFHQDPEIKAFLDKQLSKRERDWEKKFGELSAKYTEQLELFNRNRASEGKPEVSKLPPEQEQAVMQLAELLFSNQSVREKYGLSKVDQNESAIENMRREQAQASYESELGDEAKKLAEKFGGEASEWKEKLQEFYLEDDFLAEKVYRKGVMSKISKLYSADHAEELAGRQANLKLIREQKEKKAVNVAQTSNGQKASSASSNEDSRGYLKRRVQEAGGISF